MNGPAPKIVENLDWMAPPPLVPWWVWCLLAGAMAAGAALIWRGRYQRLRRATRVPGERPDDVALDDLYRLHASYTVEGYLEFVVEVSRILRVYIQNRFGLRAPHRSSEEFLDDASESDLLSASQRESLADFLTQCDGVKFARRHLMLGRMDALFQAAENFVLETAPPRDENELVALAASSS